MELVLQIKQICEETDNTWFLSHCFPKVALYDLEFSSVEYDNEDLDEDDRECVRIDALDEFIKKQGVSKRNVWDYDEYTYYKGKWILPEKIDGELPGFMLIKCEGKTFSNEGFTHYIYFAYVLPKYRRQGILKSMVQQIPNDWSVWLEANSKEVDNIKQVWELCGFTYLKTMNGHVFMCKRGV